MKKVLVLVLINLFLLSACGAKAGIEVSDVWARTSTQGMNSAVYFVIQNHNEVADDLVGAASDVADAVEVHESKMVGDVMKMTRMDSVLLEASARVEFKPGGYHVMLIGLKQDLKAGVEFDITLQFRDSPDITVKAIVREPDGMDNMEQ